MKCHSKIYLNTNTNVANVICFRNLFMQDVIVRKIQKKIDEFDEAVKQLHDFKIDTDVNITLQELHILALNQELIILKEFDNQDTQLKANVLNILSERHSLQIKVLIVYQMTFSHKLCYLQSHEGMIFILCLLNKYYVVFTW